MDHFIAHFDVPSYVFGMLMAWTADTVYLVLSRMWKR